MKGASAPSGGGPGGAETKAIVENAVKIPKK